LPSGGNPASYGSYAGSGAAAGAGAGAGGGVAEAAAFAPLEVETDTLLEASAGGGASCANATVAVDAANPKTCMNTVRFDIVIDPLASIRSAVAGYCRK
jgi:hypothetical protein